jgi:hypothetical protein
MRNSLTAMSAKYPQSLSDTPFIPIQTSIFKFQIRICTRGRTMLNLFSKRPGIA